jgi:glutamate racemase
MMHSSSPIGVFDSGIGGLSVLQALRQQLPGESFVYLADNAYAPYGERGDAFVAARTLAIGDYLQQVHAIKALVVACNTATTAAIHLLRAQWPDLLLVGVEPALKPAAACSRTGHIGVMGTRGTLGSAKFAQLQAGLPPGVHYHLQPCDGLAYAIERSALQSDGPAQAEVAALCQRYLQALGRFGSSAGAIDTLVLGCTHYVFAAPLLQHLLGPEVTLIDTGAPVARQTARLLQTAGLLAPASTAPQVQLLSTGELALLRAGACRWLQLDAADCRSAALPAPAYA